MFQFQNRQEISKASKHLNKHEQSRENFGFVRVYSRLYFTRTAIILACAVLFSAGNTFAQIKKTNPKKVAPKNQSALNLPKVTQIDAAALKNLLKPMGKPLLINFWATWCEPCREEFPDLVKIAGDYKDKIDLITVSLDDLAEINRDVPKFLAQMNSVSPAYLLKTADEGEAIAVVAKDWQGGLPFTILFDNQGATVYSKQGKFKTELLRAEIEKISASQNNQSVNGEFEKGQKDARVDLDGGKLVYKINTLPSRHLRKFPMTESHSINLESEHWTKFNYIKGYNSIVEKEISKNFGENSLDIFLAKIKKSGRINFPPEIIEITIAPK